MESKKKEAWGIEWPDGTLSGCTFSSKGAAETRIYKLNQGAVGRPSPKAVRVYIVKRRS